MDSLLIALGLLCIVGGFLGSFLPVLPGPPLSWIGLLFLHFTARIQYGELFLIMTAGVVILVSVLDYYIPLWGTKRSGGTSYGQQGAIVGLIVGLFLGPLGIILGPFVGAGGGELLHNAHDFKKAFKSGLGAFVGFLAGTAMKMIVCLAFAFYFIKDWITSYF